MRVAIVGGPGIGKSTLVRQLADLYHNGAYGEGEEGVWDPRVLEDIDAGRNPVGVTAYFARLYDANYRDAAENDRPGKVMFFEGARYRRIRFVLAHPEAPEFARLRVEMAAKGMPGELEGELIDLLNFFEFVSGLMRRGLVSKKDVDWMFRSFIDDLTQIDFVRDYILSSDYDELHVACRRKRPRGAAA